MLSKVHHSESREAKSFPSWESMELVRVQLSTVLLERLVFPVAL